MTWTTIPNGDVDPESPITTSLMTALRDNVAAAFNKDTGAPVLANNYIVAAMLSASAVTGVKLNAMTAGTEIITYWTAAAIAMTATYPTETKVIECRAGQSGTVRVGRTHDAPTMYSAVYINGVSQETAQTGSGAKTTDVTVQEGDLIQIYGNCSSDGCTGDTISDIWIGVTNGIGVVGDWSV